MSVDDTSMSGSGCCAGGHGCFGLCKLSLVAAIFFLMTIIPAVGTWVMSVHWGIWLIVAVVLGWKPMMKHLGK